MSRCKRCEGKGWVESYHGGSNTWTPSLGQCPERCDVAGYSAEVQRRMRADHVTESPVLRSMPSQQRPAPLLRLCKEPE